MPQLTLWNLSSWLNSELLNVLLWWDEDKTRFNKRLLQGPKDQVYLRSPHRGSSLPPQHPAESPRGWTSQLFSRFERNLEKGVQVRADQNPQPQKRKFAQKNVWPLETVFNQGFLVFTVHQKLVGNLLKILIPGFHALRWWFKLA